MLTFCSSYTTDEPRNTLWSSYWGNFYFSCNSLPPTHLLCFLFLFTGLSSPLNSLEIQCSSWCNPPDALNSFSLYAFLLALCSNLDWLLSRPGDPFPSLSWLLSSLFSFSCLHGALSLVISQGGCIGGKPFWDFECLKMFLLYTWLIIWLDIEF